MQCSLCISFLMVCWQTISDHAAGDWQLLKALHAPAASEGKEDDFDKRLGSLQGKGFGKTTPKQALKQSQEQAKRGEGGVPLHHA